MKTRHEEEVMVQEVEISSFDLRYERHRMKNSGVERKLLASIAERGISDPLEGVDTEGGRVLLNGFKRYRCAVKLGIGIVPYTSLGADEAEGILKLIRISNDRSLSILEQAGLIEELRNVHKMSVMEIARELSRSKAWVSVRLGITSEMSKTVRKKIFSGAFPTYSYMYTLRQFRRINCVTDAEIDDFVKAVAGKKLSIRDIERLAHGYFKGPAEFREQIKNGNIFWGLERMKQASRDLKACSELERGMLRDLEILQKYMQRVTHKSGDSRYKSRAFFAQANLLCGGILGKLGIFSRMLRRFYDRSGNA